MQGECNRYPSTLAMNIECNVNIYEFGNYFDINASSLQARRSPGKFWQVGLPRIVFGYNVKFSRWVEISISQSPHVRVNV